MGFGPDICGQTKRTHTILNYPPKKDNVMITKDISCESDELSHLYTLTIKPDNTFEVKVDNKIVREGKLEDEFEMLEPKTIKDPDQSKPEDWVDEKMIADPESIKPEGYDDIPSELPDPDAKTPDDWDDEDDGEWEPPMIDNPEFKGPWKPEMMKNPDYKGPWVHPMIDNPEYKPDDNLYAVCDEECTHVDSNYGKSKQEQYLMILLLLIVQRKRNNSLKRHSTRNVRERRPNLMLLKRRRQKHKSNKIPKGSTILTMKTWIWMIMTNSK